MQNSKRKKFFVPAILITVNAFLWSIFYFTGIFGGWQLTLQNKIYSAENRAGEEIIVVAIDDASVADAQLGRWQDWKRAFFAEAIENLQAAGAAVIGVDIIFSENSTTADDAKLIAALRKMSNVVLAAGKSGDEELLPLPEFREVSRFGFVNLNSDRTDNVVRRVRLDFGKSATNFGIEIVKNFLGISDLPENFEPNQFVLTTRKLRSPYSLNKIYPPIILPKENDGFLINFFGKSNSFPRISFTDVFHGNFDSAAVKNKIVLIGMAGATGIHDEHLTPISAGEPMPGVEIHANIIQTLLSGETLRNLSFSAGVISIFAVLLLLGLLFFLTPFWGMLIILIGELATELFAALFSFENGILLPFGYFWGGTLLIFVIAIIFRYFGEDADLRYLQKAFSRYLSPELVKQIRNNPKALGLGGAKRELTIFFSDIENFTNLSEKLSPVEVVRLLNSQLGSITKNILDEKGTLDKYIGDAVMAFWNAPLKNSNHALLACRAALNSQKSLAGNFPKIRIGIHTGPAVVGNLGLATRFNYTAVGDSVNLASRLEGVNKIYGTRIIISGETRRKAGDTILARLLDRVMVRGRGEITEIFELLTEKKGASSEQIELVKKSAEAFGFYRKRDFKRAAQIYRTIKHPSSAVMLKKINFFRKNPPPPNWKGETILKSK
ncbi:adenylate/guanylate cyclase domain-containing protein [Candidatus Gracilibacteria bacterium]|nr:adenylate/guanylate cyclase domain-containing protein [Candidatus Gracilibacteria bacterium]